MTQTLIVKAYYDDLNQTQPEIRRFELNIASENDVYRELEAKIAQLNPEYVIGQFSLQYVDEDKDRITFSSSDEFRSAIRSNNGAVLKIFVKPKQQQKSGSNNTVHHVDVTCDGCQGKVVGIRYKCVECSDYDLCETCMDKGLHSEHNMLKLVKPDTRHCPRFGGRGFGGRCGRRFWHGQQREQGGLNMGEFLKQFKGKDIADFVQQHLPPWMQTENMKQLLEQVRKEDSTINDQNILEHTGKFLQEILSSLGIDCDYSIDRKPPTTTAAAPPSTSDTTTSTTQDEASASASTSTEPKPTPPPTSTAQGSPLKQLASMFSTMLGDDQGNLKAAHIAEEEEREKRKVDECIERMTAMGFMDTNGILTELIKSHKGDLNQVLDALNPRSYTKN